MNFFKKNIKKKTFYFLFIIFIFNESYAIQEKNFFNFKNIHNSNTNIVGIVPFLFTEKEIEIEKIDAIIKSDLEHSGKFIVLNSYNLPQYPKSIEEIFISIWNKQNINFIIIGKIKVVTKNNYKISYQLVTINHFEKKVLLKNSFIIQKKWIRYAGHTISNEIFEKLIGLKGDFCSRIIYVTKLKNRQFLYELRISDYDGFNNFTIYKSKQPIMSPTWSPDGNTISYVIFETVKTSLVIQKINSGMIEKIISFPNHNGAPAFSPDGKKIAFVLSKSGNFNIYILNLNSKNIKNVTNEKNNNTEPRWFPDNQSIVYTSDQIGIPQVYKKKENEKEFIERLSWNSSSNQDADISSDGKFLVMVSNIDGKQSIIKYNIENNFLQKLTNTILNEHPRFSPNNNMIIYSSYQNSSSTINIVSTNGLFKSCILKSDNENYKFPSWSP